MKTNVCIKGETYKIPVEVDEYIRFLDRQLRDLEYNNMTLRREVGSLMEEMKAIKPIVGHKDYKPAMSSDCRECRYVVRSKYDGSILGCRKDNVCADFMPED